MQVNWESYRYFLQSVRSGSMKAAAKRLGVDYTTVYRHVKQLEKQLGSKLLLRDGREQRTSPEGEILYEKLQRAEDELFSAESLFMESRSELKGEVRISTSDSVGIHFMPELIAAFQSDHPNIQINHSIDLNYVRLEKKEAEIAIAAGQGHPDYLMGYPLGKASFGLYGLLQDGSPFEGRDLESLSFVTLSSAFSHLGHVKWIHQNIPDYNIRARASHHILLHHLIRAGVGVGMLPTYLGDNDPDLVRHPDVSPGYSVEFWVVYHPDLKTIQRVVTTVQFIREFMEERLVG